MLEVLVSLALLGLLMTLVFQGTRFATQSWAAMTRTSNAATDFDAARTVLRHAITMAYPDFASDSLTDRTIAFSGTSTELTLVAPLPASIEAGVLADEQFLAVPSEGGRVLVMRWRLHLPPSDAAFPLRVEQVTLLDKVGAVRFSYFGAYAPREPPAWLDRWTNQDRLPELVRVQFIPVTANAGRWPDLIVKPRLTANTSCVYDPGETTCRRVR